MAKKGPTLRTEYRSQLGRESRKPRFSAREEMSVARSVHTDSDRNGAPLSCAWQQCTTALTSGDRIGGDPLCLPNNVFVSETDIK